MTPQEAQDALDRLDRLRGHDSALGGLLTLGEVADVLLVHRDQVLPTMEHLGAPTDFRTAQGPCWDPSSIVGWLTKIASADGP